jgi:hypothetical protein
MRPSARHNTLWRIPRDLVLDTFNDTQRAGAVVLSQARSGALRSGTDTENKLSASDGNLVMGQLTTNGWQREGVAYGPYTRKDGLCFVFKVVDGDVQAQQTTPSIVNEHLAAGAFSSTSPSDPTTDGSGLIFYANGTAAGALCRNGSNSGSQSGLIDNANPTSIKQIPFYLIVHLRADGAAYYLASLPSVRQLPSAGFPTAQLVHVAALNRTTTPLYAGVWQRQTYFKDTHLDGVDVVQSSTWSNWYASAQVANSFIGSGSVGSSLASDVAGSPTWVVTGSPNLTSTGLQATAATANLRMASATHFPASTTGLITCKVITGTNTNFGFLLALRWDDTGGGNGYYFSFDSGAVVLYRENNGVDTSVATFSVTLSGTQTIVVTDDGATLTLWMDNRQIIRYATTTFNTQTGLVVFILTGSGHTVSYYEAHPRSVTIPTELRTLGDPALDWPAQGSTSVYTEDFAGSAANLEGKTTTTGSGVWANNGPAPAGSIKLTGAGKAQFQTATAAGNNAIYTVPWSVLNYADLTVDITVPGTGYGNGTTGWAGVVFYQDANNYISVRTYVKDDQVGSTEYELEDRTNGSGPTVIQRVNMATEISHGNTFTMRMVCDGERVVCYKDGEPIIVFRRAWVYGSVPSIQINRVGIIGYDSDSGSSYDNFVAKSF